MNIIVCIKQVPETAEVNINPDTNTLIREGVDSIINPFDLYAIEEAIRIREMWALDMWPRKWTSDDIDASVPIDALALNDDGRIVTQALLIR